VNIGSLILLALAACFYPTLLAGVILILGRPRPLRMLMAFLIGGLAISVAAGVLIINALEGSGAVDRANHSTKPIVAIVAGTVSLLVAWGVWSGRVNRGLQRHERTRRRPTDPHKPSVVSRTLSRGSITMAFLAGLVLNLPGVWYLNALTEIAKADPSGASALLQILLFNVIMFALVELPIVAYLVDPQGAAERVNRFSAWVHDHSRQVAIALATGIGMWLIVKGIVNLPS
jgi:Sap, sulfolipid-1-addressing protein